MVKKFVFIHMRVNIHIREGVLLVSIGSQIPCVLNPYNSKLFLEETVAKALLMVKIKSLEWIQPE